MKPSFVRGVGACIALIGICALVVIATAQPGPAPDGMHRVNPGWHALVNARVIPEPGREIQSAMIVIRNGAITEITPTGAGIAPPPGARVWDCAGLTIYPGLIEPYLPIDAPTPDRSSPGAHWNAKVTAERSALDGRGVPEDVRKKLRSMGYTTAVIAPTGGVFRGTAAVVSLGEQRDPSRPLAGVVEPKIAHVVALESGGGRSTGYPGSKMGAIALVRQTLSDVYWHARASEAHRTRPGAFERPAPNDSFEALLAPKPRFVLFDVDHEQDIERVARIGREFGREFIVVGSGTELRRLPAAAAAGAPIILPLRAPERPRVETPADFEATDLSDLMLWEQWPTNPRRVVTALQHTYGGRAALTTSKLPRGQEFFTNLREAMELGGLTEEQALAMMTTEPAAIYDMSERLGRIVPGMPANLVVVKGSLFDEKRVIRDVWVDGERYEITAAPIVELEGVWSITLPIDQEGKAAAPGQGLVGELRVGEDGSVSLIRPSGEAGPGQPARRGEPDAPIGAAPEQQPGANPDLDALRRAAGIDKLQGEARERAEARLADLLAVRDQAGPEATDDADAGAPPEGDDPDDEPEIEMVVEKPGQPRGKEHSIRARSVTTLENRVSFLLDVDALKPSAKPAPGEGDEDKPQPERRSGVVTLSGVVEGEVIHGEGVLPGGERFVWTATRTGPLEKKDEKPKPEREKPPESYGLPFGAYGYDGFPAQRDMLITGATIWTSGPRGIIENGTLWVRGGKVAGVFGAGEGGLPIPDASVVQIDAGGRHITPGLIDCHSHTGIMGGVNEGTLSSTAMVRIFDVIDPDAIGWYRELAGGITAVNQLHGSANSIGGQNSVVKLRWGVGNADEMRFEDAIAGIKFALGENVKQSNWGERFTTRYPQTRMGVETFIRDRFTAAREYDTRWQRWRQSGGNDPSMIEPQRDLELEALAEILRGERLVHCHSYRQDEILMLCRIAEEFGFTIGTFQHVLEGYKVAEAIREHAIGGSAFSDWWAYKFEVVDAIPYAGAIMHDAGVVVSFNSDSDEMARRMNVEAAKVVKYGGLPPEEALKFVTLNPAKQLKIDGRVGSLEVGKDADFVIWSGNPLSSMSRCEATYIEGREMFTLARDRELRAQAENERRRIAQKIMSDPKGKSGSSGGPGGRGGRGGQRQPETEPPEPTLDQVLRGGWITPVRDDQDPEEARQAAMHKLMERRFMWMISNGLDPLAPMPGDCGCGIHGLFMMDGGVQ